MSVNSVLEEFRVKTLAVIQVEIWRAFCSQAMLESNSGEEKLSVKQRSSYADMRVEWLGTFYQND